MYRRKANKKRGKKKRNRDYVIIDVGDIIIGLRAVERFRSYVHMYVKNDPFL